MNKNCYRIIFSQRLGQRVVVAENIVTKRCTGGAGSEAIATDDRAWRIPGLAGLLALSLLGMIQLAFAAPTGGKVVAGSAGITQNGALTTVQQASRRAIVNWQSFGIDKGETVRINAPSVDSATLNRVTGKLGTRIDGTLSGNGKVFLVNPNGIVVGRDGVVNVQGGFVASTQDINDAAFMAGGALNFQGGTDGKVQILGTIKSDSGDIVILAPRTEIGAEAKLQAAAGAIQLIAASDVTLSNGQFTVQPKTDDAGQITAAGAIEAAKVQLAAVNGNLGALAINVSGTVRATGTQQNPDGSISLVASGAGGNVTVNKATLDTSNASGAGGVIRIEGDAQNGTALVTDSTLDASSANGAGGKIDITAHHTGLTGEITADARGATQGGAIRVGGGFQGKEGDIANAEATYVGTGATLLADGTEGNAAGGKVVVWADGTTRFGGSLSTRGHGSGKGGDAEVSGKTTLVFEPKSLDLHGGDAGGQAGTLLLDPTDVIIDNAVSDSNFTGTASAPNFSASGGTSTISGASFKTALQAGAVTIDSSGGNGGNGDITFQGTALGVATTGNKLTLKATRDINFNTSLLAPTATNLRELNAYAGRDINWNADTRIYYNYLYAARNINISAPMSLLNSNNLYAGTSYSGGAWTYSNNWQQGTNTGAINFSGAGALNGVSGGASLSLYSGVNPLTGSRSNFSLSQITGNVPAGLNLYGLNKVNIDRDLPTGGSINVYARDVDFSASQVNSNHVNVVTALYDASNASTNYYSYNFGWQFQQGAITFSNPNIQFNNSTRLTLTSGLGTPNTASYAGNGRTDIPASIQFNPTHTGVFELQGFRDVTLNEAISASGISISTRNLSVGSNLSATGNITLLAGSYDPGAATPNIYNAAAWRTQLGTVSFAPNLTLQAQDFTFYSGIDPANATVAGGRLDLPTTLTLLPAVGQTTANSLTLLGFRDVIYPEALATVVNNTQIIARNITVPSSITTLRAIKSSLILNAGAFYNSGSNINFANPGTSMPGDGWLSLPANLSVQSPYVTLASSVKSATDSSRAPASFTQIQSEAATQAATGETLGIWGFGDVTLPAISHNPAFNSGITSRMEVQADNITLNGDLSSSSINLFAGNYNPSVYGSGAGSRFTFNNNPVLYGGAYASSGINWDSITLNAGANNIKPLTGVSFGYMPGVSSYVGFALSNFNGTEVTMKNGADLSVYYPTSGGIEFAINQVSKATGDVVLNSNVIVDASLAAASATTAQMTLGGGGLRMGDKVLSTKGKAFTLYRTGVASSRNAALNLDAPQLNLYSDSGSTSTGKIVVNAVNNLILNEPWGNPQSLEVNARGELTVTAVQGRSGNASLTLRGDATTGQTIAQGDTTGTLVNQNLNTLFANYNQGLYGETGGDGLGAVTLAAAGPISVTPIFRQTMVAESAFTVNVANTFFKLDGTAYALNAVIPKGTVLTMSSSYYQYQLTGNVTANQALDTVTDNGVPLRNAYTVQTGGYTLGSGETNLFYTAAGVPIAGGTVLTTGTVVYVKPGYSMTGKNLSGGARWSSSGAQLYTVGGYNTASSGATVLTYTSKGTGFTASNTWNTAVGANSATSASTLLSVDTAAVDTSLAANYYGNPITGGSTALNMSGQFYTLGGSNQATPSKLNGLATGSGNNSASGNGWDTGYGTATASTAAGDLRIYSGPTHAIAGAGFAAGDAADLNIYNNPTSVGFGYTNTVRDGAGKLTTVTGSLVALGYRDVNVESGGTLTSGGNVTIGAARDLNFNTNVTLGSANKLATLIAGNEINSNGYTISSLPVVPGDLMLVAGHGVNVNTNVARIAGGLQDAPTMTGVLAGGVSTAEGLFKVTNTGALTVGGTLTNTEVPNVLFDGSTGILYPDAAAPLTRDSVSTTAGTGNIDIQTNTGNLTVAGGGVNSTVGGEISLKAAAATADVLLDGDVSTTGNAYVQAGRNIAQSNTTKKLSANTAVLTAAGAIGSAANRIQTKVNTLALNAGGNAYVTEANALTLAAKSTNNGAIDVQTTAGTLTVGTVTANPTVGRAAGTGASGYTGVTAAGTGAVTLTANGATSDVALGATVRSGTGSIAVTAGNNILDTLAGDLGSGTDTSTSNKLNLATGGNVTLHAGNSIGGTGSGTPDALEVWSGGTLTSTSSGTTADAGTYLNLLNTGSGINAPGSISSGKNLDLTSRASTTSGTGKLTVTGAVQTANDGYVRLAADKDVVINNTVTANGSGNLVVTAGLGGTGNLTQGANGALTSGSGEINLRAQNDIALGANVSTGGNVLAQAVTGAITQSGGVLSADQAALTSAGAIGSASNRLQTNVNTLALNAGGNAYVTEANALTLAATSTNNGAIDVQTTAGTLTVGSVAVATTVTPATGGITPLAVGQTLAGVTADGTGAVTLTANGATSDVALGATVRSGTGSIAVTAGNNILDTLAGDLGSGTDTSTSGALNLATGGNVTLHAGNSIGSTGSGTPDALEVWSGGTLTSTSNGTTADAGTYLNLLDTGSGANLAAISSGKNLDLTSRASTTSGTGKLTVTGAVQTANDGYVRLAADKDVVINNTVTANGSGNLVVTAGLGGTGNLTQGANGALTSGSGEINLRAQNDIALGANVSTGGNVLAQAVTGAITQSGGVLSADQAALTSAGAIGSASNRLQTNVNTLALNAGGNAYVTEANALTLAATSTNNGAIDVQTTAGTLTVGSVAVATTVTPTTGGITPWLSARPSRASPPMARAPSPSPPTAPQAMWRWAATSPVVAARSPCSPTQTLSSPTRMA